MHKCNNLQHTMNNQKCNLINTVNIYWCMGSRKEKRWLKVKSRTLDAGIVWKVLFSDLLLCYPDFLRCRNTANTNQPIANFNVAATSSGAAYIFRSTVLLILGNR